MQFIKDSLGRNIQTKKESVVDGAKCWIVSGYLTRDKMGRAIEQGTPTAEDYADEGIIDNSYKSLENSTLYEYDDFGRFHKATMPNGYEVTKEYDINKETSGIEIVDMVIDSEQRSNVEYKDM